MPTFPPRPKPPIDVVPRRSAGSGRWRLALLAVLLLLVFFGRTLTSVYVETLWFDSLGYASVFWRTVAIKALVFGVFFVASFVLLEVAFWFLRPRRLATGFLSRTVVIRGRPFTFSVGRGLRLVEAIAALLVAFAGAASLATEWETLALYWMAPAVRAAAPDPIFGRPVEFYLFTLPARDLLATWLAMLAFIALVASGVYYLLLSGERAFGSRGAGGTERAYGGLSVGVAAVLGALAWRVYLARFDKMFAPGSIFSGVKYTDDRVLIPGLLLVAVTLALGAVAALVNAAGPRRLRWLVAAVVPVVVAYAGVALVAWYVQSFVVRPNELVRESPYIANNIRLTREAFGLAAVEQRHFPAATGVEALDLRANWATIDNIRLWDWRVLQDTLGQIQAIRTYYDFPDIDIDRYVIGGQKRQVMVAARELNVGSLPEGSRSWINEKLIYTHGYGVTMNPVNGFTSEGLPQLILRDMPVASSAPGIRVTRPEIYFGQETTTDVYVRTGQKEFNYPEGESNNLTTYEGTGGIAIGSYFRRLLLAIDRGDVTRLPFSNDIRPDSRLLMRREIGQRLRALAPFLTFDPDPYIVVGSDGRLYWLVDGFTTSRTYPGATAYRLQNDNVNYVRNSVKAVVDAYEGSVSFYVFDPADPVVNAYGRVFPALFKPASAMPATVRDHVRYPEVLLAVQATVYALYHMTDPQVFYNREDLWSIPSPAVPTEGREQAAPPIEPNFVMMRLPGEEGGVEYVAILPFTPSKRNNLIGWLAGRSDGEAYGRLLAYDFPKTSLVDGPLQVEARIDQNPQLSSQLTLWNQQGSRVRRGNLLVIPTGRALLYSQAIYLQAVHSPMPELRLVILAMQDRLAYGPAFDVAAQNLLGEARGGQGTLAEPAGVPALAAGPEPDVVPPAGMQELIDQAARDLADYQRLTAEGKLGEAGQRLESLKRTLDQLTQSPKR